jgi:hypothetical protein
MIPNTGGNNESIADATATTKQARTTVRKERAVDTGVHSGVDSGEPSDQPMYQHQREVVERFQDKNEGALFMEMGTGKSRAILEIATP